MTISPGEASEHSQEGIKPRATQVPAAEAGNAGQGAASHMHTQTCRCMTSFFFFSPLVTVLFSA